MPLLVPQLKGKGCLKTRTTSFPTDWNMEEEMRQLQPYMPEHWPGGWQSYGTGWAWVLKRLCGEEVPLQVWVSPTHYYAKGKYLCCAVLSGFSCVDSLLPYGLEPARFLCSWDSPGENTEWVPCRLSMLKSFNSLGYALIIILNDSDSNCFGISDQERYNS